MLVAVAGYAGAGKTTVLESLQGRGVGEIVYVGAYVQEEVLSRGLTLSPENEQRIRQALRDELGRDALAKRAVGDLQNRQARGTILLDAIYLKEEEEFYRKIFGKDVLVLAIRASFDIRAERIAAREIRPLSIEQLRYRDDYESRQLRLDEVLATADHNVINEGTLEMLERSLDALCSRW